MTDSEQRAAARKFVKDWTGKGYEKGESQKFWLSLLQDVLGAPRDPEFVKFEERVHYGTTNFIDARIPSTRVFIEQKSIDKDLNQAAPQSNGQCLTPFEQVLGYIAKSKLSEHPKWVVVCNFAEFHIHDMEHPDQEPEVIFLKDLEKEYYRLKFLVDSGDDNVRKEMEISLQAGEIVGALYDGLLPRYKTPDSPETLKSLNVLCVRLVFCLYAEDAGIFGSRTLFHDYLKDLPANQIRPALRDLFKVLNQKPEDRDKYLPDDNPKLAAFPYVNGGLFADSSTEIPPFDEDLKMLLLTRATGFDWSEISPTIFGAVFESTLNPETRRSGGMHYTSIQNIHKVIDPLFLDDLRKEFKSIEAIPVLKTQMARLKAFQNKLASLTFLDPACGSGNFLTETYLCLRRIENDVIGLINRDQIIMGDMNPIHVSIGQFYGIEINDFAVSVAKTALWIAESQMMKATEDIVHMNLEFLPLRSYAHIVEGNALRMDWKEVVPPEHLSFIMGNPPFVGYALQSKEQKDDLQATMPGVGKNLDYVAGWYFKAAEYMKGTYIRAAFVSTNSITQGEQICSVWKPIFDKYTIHIDFAHRTFRWDSEASIKAHVHCVIVGFSFGHNDQPRMLFNGDEMQTVENINAYLLDAPNVFIERRTVPLCDVPPIYRGSQPTDDGNLILSEDEKEELLAKEPQAAPLIRPFMMGKDFIERKPRYCLWLADADPVLLRRCPKVMERVKRVQEFRLASKKAATRAKAETPTLFDENHECKSDYVAIPKVSSENRRYIPIDYMKQEVIAGDKLFTMPVNSLYAFGVLTSNVHMAWMRAVCGRLEMRYSYSNTIVYNNFPWPEPTEEQRMKIEKTAQAILDARAKYPQASFSVLYDPFSMPADLRKAHQQNDRAVMEAYGLPVAGTTESSCVAFLMKRYQELTAN